MARGTEDKTGQATRERHRRQLLERWGAWCWVCLAAGYGRRARINLRLKWPHPRCLTRDHVVPRCQGGTDDVDNMRPAHNLCNTRRGSLDRWRRSRS